MYHIIHIFRVLYRYWQHVPHTAEVSIRCSRNKLIFRMFASGLTRGLVWNLDPFFDIENATWFRLTVSTHIVSAVLMVCMCMGWAKSSLLGLVNGHHTSLRQPRNAEEHTRGMSL